MSRLTRLAEFAGLAALIALAGCGNGKIIGSGAQPTASPAPVHVSYEYKVPAANAQPATLASGADSYIYFTEQATSQIGRMSTGGSFTEIATPTANSLPTSIVLGPNAHMWFTEQSGNKIGTFATFASTAFTEYLIPWVSRPAFITPGGQYQSLYFTDLAQNGIGEVTTSGVFSGPFTIPTANANPQGIVTDQFHDEWFTEYDASKIGVLNTNVSPQAVTAEYATPTANAHPDIIVMGPDGNLWFTENIAGAPQLGSINPSNGTITEYALSGAKSAVGLALDLSGQLVITDNANNSIGVFNIANHTFAEYSIPTANSNPLWIGLGPDGRMYFTEFTANQIGQFSYF